jgi:2-keto-myo-inositol isomerase
VAGLTRQGEDRDVLRFAINHMTVPRLRHDELLRLAKSLGCVGVELRNDLGRPVFDGAAPEAVRAAARDSGVRVVGLSQVYPFNAWSDSVREAVAQLIADARACGAETISLIPRNDGHGTSVAERRENAATALREIRPMLEEAGLVALVEPLGFETSSLRHKAETIEILERVGGRERFGLVHDTFHHHLAGGGELFPEWTGIVHVSGVVDHDLALSAIRDEHRVLVDADDRLGNVAQLIGLVEAGYRGPISFEAFSPAVHAAPDPEAGLRASIAFLEAALARVGA